MHRDWLFCGGQIGWIGWIGWDFEFSLANISPGLLVSKCEQT